MTTTSVKEVKKWIEKLTDRGIIEFRYRDLPDDLKSKKMLHKGRVTGLLKSGKKENYLSLWEISYRRKRK
jgi:RAB protein geranylgeranyltransferase component A